MLIAFNRETRISHWESLMQKDTQHVLIAWHVSTVVQSAWQILKNVIVERKYAQRIRQSVLRKNFRNRGKRGMDHCSTSSRNRKLCAFLRLSATHHPFTVIFCPKKPLQTLASSPQQTESEGAIPPSKLIPEWASSSFLERFQHLINDLPDTIAEGTDHDVLG